MGNQRKDPQRELQREREKWQNFPRRKPARVVKPRPGQESVWDYPRPPRVEPVGRRIRVEFGGAIIADSTAGYRILETASPPVYYFPPHDVRQEHLEPVSGRTLCEWKGLARYWSVRVAGRVAERGAWSYPDPDPAYRAITGYLAFYPGRMDACFVGAERVIPQLGDYYGGWITRDLVGPFKGEPGSEGW